MVFGNISTLYLPTAANAGSSQWGTDVRKLLDSADAGSDATTKTDHGTGGTAVVRTFDPYSTTSADLDQTLYGWAVTPSDMGSVSGARRFLHAGNHVATLRVGHTAAVAKNANFAMYVYRVGPSPSRTRTQLGTANSGTISIPSLGGEITVTITVALGEIVLEADETLQYSFEVGAAGTTITGDVITLFTGTQSSVVGKIAIPTLGVLADTTGTGAGSSTVSGVGGLVLGTVGAAVGVGSAAGVGGSRADTTGTASGTATVDGAGSSVAGTVGTASGDAIVDGVGGLVLGTVGTATVGGDCPADWSPNDGLKAISGIVLFHEPPNQGNPVSGATVKLIRDSDGLLIATTTTDALGAYSFPRDSNDPNTYHVEVTWTDGGTPQQGLSQGGCAPQ